jgi:hypothetical protein
LNGSIGSESGGGRTMAFVINALGDDGTVSCLGVEDTD